MSNSKYDTVERPEQGGISMGGLEQAVLRALRTHAEPRKKHGKWARVATNIARGDVELARLDCDRSFNSALSILTKDGFYRTVDNGKGEVKME